MLADCIGGMNWPNRGVYFFGEARPLAPCAAVCVAVPPTWYFVLYFGCTREFMPRSCSFGRQNGQRIDHYSPESDGFTHQRRESPRQGPCWLRIPVHRERPFRSNVNTDSDRW